MYKRLIVLAAALGLSASVASAATEFKADSSFEQNGLKVEMDIAPLNGKDRPVHESEDARLRFRITEAGEAGQPIGGLFPLSWLTSRGEKDAAPDDKACNFQIRSLLAGRLARVADVNLNQFLLITLDDNNSISIIDPQIESSQTKTLGMVSLTSKGTDFVLAPDRRNVLVTLSGQGRVAAADIFKRKAQYVDTGGHPRRIILQPDTRLAWVGDEDGDSVHAIDAEVFKLRGSVKVGPGPHEFAFKDNSREAYVVSSASPLLSVVDSHSLKLKKQVEIGKDAISVGYSHFSGNIYVALAGGKVVVLDQNQYRQKAVIDLKMKISVFAVTPDSRFGFALHGKDNQLSIVDLTKNKVIQTIKTDLEPNHLDFTETFAYIHHAQSGDALLVDLATLRQNGKASVAPVVLGQQAPAAGRYATIAPIIAPLPEGGGALIMNAADRNIYHFMEGMNAPMGAYQTYPWPARGVLISDRTIREMEKGLYQTEFRLPAAGVYTLPFLVPSSPQLHGCFTITVKGKRKQIKQYGSIQLEPLPKELTFTTGKPQSLRVYVTDPASDKPVTDVKDLMLLVMQGPRWQWRGAATPVGGGHYEVNVTFPKAGQYMIMAASTSRNVNFGQTRSLTVKVEDAGKEK